MFGAVGIELTRKGWPVIPADGRTPFVRWRRYRRQMPAEIEAAVWARRYPDANVALVLGHGVVALDCDADDIGEATILGELANQHFGRSGPIRVGQWPRHARLFRGGRGIRTRRGGNVELKGSGQLITVYGTHPETGEPYRYAGPELRQLRPAQLPLITRKQTDRFWEAVGAYDEAKGRKGGGATGLTFTEAMNGVPEGRRHAAMLTIASAARGWDFDEDRAHDLVREAASRCQPPLPARDGYQVVRWVYDHLPAGIAKEPPIKGSAVPQILRVSFNIALGGRPFNRRDRYEVLIAMCHEMQAYLGDKPIALPQPALARVLRCSQQAVSNLIQRALADEILLLEQGHYRPGHRAKLYRVAT